MKLKEEYVFPKKTHRPYIAIRYRGKTATFLWNFSSENMLKSSVDLKIQIEWNELVWLARALNCCIKENEIIFSNIDMYNRALLYACIRKTVRSPKKARHLAHLIFELNSWEVFYWASAIRENWWKNKNVKQLYRAAKAFKLLFNID